MSFLRFIFRMLISRALTILFNGVYLLSLLANAYVLYLFLHGKIAFL